MESFCNIWRSGYDLYGLCFPYVDLAHDQLVSVRMTFYGKNFSYYDLFQILSKQVNPSTLVPVNVIASVYSWAAHIQVRNICFNP